MDRKTHTELKKMLLGKGLIALPLHRVRPSGVQVEHYIELNNDEPIYHKLQRLSPRHNTIVKEEIEKMLRVGLIKPISSALSFTVMIAIKRWEAKFLRPLPRVKSEDDSRPLASPKDIKGFH